MGAVGGGLQSTDGSGNEGDVGEEPRRTGAWSRVMACIAEELAPTEAGADSVLIRAPKEVIDGEAGREDRLGDDGPLLTLTDLVGDPSPSYAVLCRCRLAWWICICS
jgi:hypothetical protein